LRAAILSRADVDAFTRAYQKQPGYTSLRDAAEDLVKRGLTDKPEVTRVLGASTPP
jgi:hypothetical protein